MGSLVFGSFTVYCGPEVRRLSALQYVVFYYNGKTYLGKWWTEKDVEADKRWNS
jgi:hypothetical protein